MDVKYQLQKKDITKAFVVDYDERSQSIVLTIHDENVFPLIVRVHRIMGDYRLLKTKNGGLQMTK